MPIGATLAAPPEEIVTVQNVGAVADNPEITITCNCCRDGDPIATLPVVNPFAIRPPAPARDGDPRVGLLEATPVAVSVWFWLTAGDPSVAAPVVRSFASKLPAPARVGDPRVGTPDTKFVAVIECTCWTAGLPTVAAPVVTFAATTECRWEIDGSTFVGA
jgi:hypothetical protein